MRSLTVFVWTPMAACRIHLRCRQLLSPDCGSGNVAVPAGLLRVPEMSKIYELQLRVLPPEGRDDFEQRRVFNRSGLAQPGAHIVERSIGVSRMTDQLPHALGHGGEQCL